MRFLTFLMLISAVDFTLAWMDKIPNNKLLTQLTIPGTHNSYARFGTGWHQCQDWTISEQLNNGIRFFDVRFRPYKNYFTVHHGDKFMNKVGGDVFKDFKKFLQNNPKETVLISIKDETSNDRIDPYPGSMDFKTILNSYLNDKNYKPYIYQNDKVIPTIGEARGKMVIIDKDGHCGFGLSKITKADRWELKDDFYPSVDTSGCVHDPTYDSGFAPDCAETTWHFKTAKLDGIKENMQGAVKNRRKRSQLFLTFCSGSSFPSKSNRQLANLINPQVMSYVRSHTADQRNSFGVVIFDYPTRDIIQFLIQHNPGQKKVCAVVEDEGRTKSWTIGKTKKRTDHLYLGGIGWNDEIAYVHLARGCYLHAWTDMNKEGTDNFLLHKKDRHLISRSSTDYEIRDDGWIYRWWANDISSLNCQCQ